MATELGQGYISIVPRTDEFASKLKSALDSAVNDAVNSAGSQISRQMGRHGTSAGQGFGKAFGSQLSSSVPGLSGFSQLTSQYESAAGKAGAVAGRALGLAFTTAAGAAIGAASYTLFKGFERYQALDAAKNRLDHLNDSFVKLGKTGVDVTATMKTVNDVVMGTPFSLSDAFTQATTAIASGVTNIKQYMTDVADAAAFAGTDIASIGQAFSLVVNQGKVDAGLLQNQLQNIPFRAWLQEIYQGVDISKAISDGRIGIEQLQYAVEKFASGTAKSAGDTIAGAIENMQTAVARLGANFLSALFGKPTEDANGLKEAIDQITERLDDVNKWVTTHAGDIKQFFENAKSTIEQVISAIKEVTAALGGTKTAIEVAGTAFLAWKVGGAITAVSGMATAIGGVNTALGATAGAAGTAALGIAGLAAAAAAIPAWIVALIKNADYVAPAASVAPPASAGPAAQSVYQGGGLAGYLAKVPKSEGGMGPDPGEPGYDPNWRNNRNVVPPTTGPISGMPLLPGNGLHWDPKKGWVTDDGNTPPDFTNRTVLGPPPPLGPGSDKDKKTSTPKPVVPFNTQLPDWAAGTPETPAFFAAETAWLNARHDLETKRAVLQQLEQDSTATAQQILDAKNDVLQQERDMHEQDMRLQEARIKAYEEAYKTGKDSTKNFGDLTSSLADITKLDADLGVSRGLVGLADNLIRFLSGIAAAPIEGLLNGVISANQSKIPSTFPDYFGGTLGKGGSGAGMPDLFSSLLGGGGGAQPAMAGSDMPRQGESARDYAHRVMMPKWQKQGYTVGDHAADQYGEHQNGALDIMVPNLGAGASVLSQVLSDPNVYGAIFNNQTYGYGHGQIPQRYGAGFTGNPTQDHQDHVHVWYKPGGSNNMMPVLGQPQQQQPQQQLPFPLPGFASGGTIPGSGSGDTIPVMATPGEHMLTTADVAAMGGQQGVYDFRYALHREGGGEIGWTTPPPPETITPTDLGGLLGAPTTPTPPLVPGTMPGPPQPAGQPHPGTGAAPGDPNVHLGSGTPPGDPNLPSSALPTVGPDGMPLGPDGQPTSPQDQFLQRLAGFIPQAAKANEVAGESNLSKIWMMGASVINNLLDKAGQAASTAAAAGIAAGTMGAGAAAAPAAAAATNLAIGIGIEAAKRGVSYGAQVGGILSDALIAQLFPFGAPHWIGFDSAQDTLGPAAKAQQQKDSRGIYDQGGVLPPGGTAVNLSTRPESVLTEQQWNTMRDATVSALGGGAGSTYNVYASDVDEAIRKLKSKERLAALQYTGRP